MTTDRKPPPSRSVALAAPDQSEFILFQAEDGQARVEVRLYEGTVWLTQRQLADLYQIKVPSVPT